MKIRRIASVTATAAAFALVMTACSGGDDGAESTESPTQAAASGGSFSMYIGEPENALVPGNTSETEGGQIVDALWTGLVTYGDETELTWDGVAESIESDDATTWTVTLKDGWTFHDGTPVDAKSFVDAWNYTSYSPNGYGNSYFFSNIVGYDELQAETDDEGEVVEDPAATEMSGLEVVDEKTFTVELTGPFAQFPITTGYTAFFPLPEAFFDDPDAFGKKPIGNGPFMAETELVPGQGITLARYEDYAGPNKANADSVELRIYSSMDTAYLDVQGGSLDIVDTIPPDAITTAPDVFGDRYQEFPSSSFTYVGIPTYDERYQDKRVRQAISMAIDREAITEAIFNGTRLPAADAIPPVIDGYREDACKYCTLNVEEANTLLDEAGFDRSQPIELWFNAGAGHDAWVEAVGNQVKQNLGVDFVLKGDLDFAQYLPLGDAKGFTGPFRLGWVMDYPSPQNYLEPLYSTAALPPAGSNASFYSNPEFDALISQGNQAATNEEAIALYQQADDVLLEDLPIIPMFFGLVQSVNSENVTNVRVDAFTRVDLPAVQVVNP
ncbi:4-phytase [Xylanimonas cellulosilytica DSM 15894]|uniref:4-phytase n=1 Tax=Xylanimonas cellulosilytica (strain DSM 15894 / JCM 12276 / CECT 5975 / KCTC 9989 / LMG 20990 / NBRC 107835 / XIL07) TaxID=446471 RepID=D1BYQ8_XYLCX|nr:ABC transporter substrate-binding protein [Xylanimonas cellulosilytica]ACZ29983.1 4-phytase [Xylanimonas cellulosilytica DSM 15894]